MRPFPSGDYCRIIALHDHSAGSGQTHDEPREASNLLAALAAPDGHRWRVARPFVYFALLNTIAGGLVAAVTGPTDFELGSWVAAYLVLVGGIAQLGLGVTQAHLGATTLSMKRVRLEFVLLNTSSAVVIAGTIVGIPIVTTFGGAVLFGSLVVFLTSVSGDERGLRIELLAYRALIWFVLLSVPVGLVLSWVRRG